MRAAAAEVAVECLPDLAVGRRRISLQQRRRAHQDAGNAIAALQRLLGDERALQWVWLFGGAKALDRGDILVRHRPERHIAGRHRAVPHDDITGAALAGAAAEMRPGHAELCAQNIQQRSIGIGVDLRLRAIEAKSNARHRGRTYCGLSNFLTTSAHFTISARRNLSNSSGVIDIGTAPCWVQSLTMSGRFRAAFTAALSLSITGLGVPAGAIRPSQMVAS